MDKYFPNGIGLVGELPRKRETITSLKFVKFPIKKTAAQECEEKLEVAAAIIGLTAAAVIFLIVVRMFL